VPRSKLARIGLLIALLGFAILGASLYTWTQDSPPNRLFYKEDEHQWVRADSSSAPAVESDETWQVSAACQRPYFVEATEQARAKLKAYGDTAPDEIRAWRDRPGSADVDDDLKLHTKYQDWFLPEFRLAEQLKQWERRLSAVADRSMSLGEAHRRVMDVRTYISNDPELASAGRDFDHFVFFLLGLGGFPDEQMKTIQAACISITSMKKIVTKTTWRTDIWRWPLDQPAGFWPGLALVLIGLVLSATVCLRRHHRA
jgi:hypothetical protein